MAQGTPVEDQKYIFNVSHAQIFQFLQNAGIHTVYSGDFRIFRDGMGYHEILWKVGKSHPAGMGWEQYHKCHPMCNTDAGWGFKFHF